MTVLKIHGHYIMSNNNHGLIWDVIDYIIDSYIFMECCNFVNE